MKTEFLVKYLIVQGVDLKVSEAGLDLGFNDGTVDCTLLSLAEKYKQDIVSHLSGASATYRWKIMPAPDKEMCPVTPSQLHTWLLCQNEEANRAYCQPLVLRIEGSLSTLTLQAALEQLVSRHEILRTHFTITADGSLGQKVLSVQEACLLMQIYDIVDGQSIDDAISSFAPTSFQLQDVTLFQACLIRSTARESFLCLNLHQIISDDHSLEILLADLMHIYNGLVTPDSAPLPPLRIQFKDYAVWMNNKERSQTNTYWSELLSGELPLINLPTYQARPAIKTYRGNIYTHAFDRELLEQLRKFSQEQNGTTFMGLLAGLNGMLFRYTGQTDVILGTPVSGRVHPDLHGQIGLYSEVLPVRTQFNASDSFTTLFFRQKTTLESVYVHAEEYSVTNLAQRDFRRDRSRSHLFDVQVIHQCKRTQPLIPGFSGLKVSLYDIKKAVSRFDLTFIFKEKDDTLELSVQYNTDLFQEAFIRDLACNTEQFIKECLKDPQKPINTISYLNAEQLQLLLGVFNDTAVPYFPDLTMISLFEEQVRKTPTNIAFVCQDRQISYQELDERSTHLALYLQSLRAAGTVVGVCMGRSIEMMTAILAILKTGAAYLPLDPFYPLDRIDYVIAHSRAHLILTNDQTTPLIASGPTVVNIDDAAIWQGPQEGKTPDVGSAETAYVIYTSGSTGKPKGVKVSHGSLANFMMGMDKKFGRGQQAEVWLALTSISFDISMLELLWTLTRGAKVVIHLERPLPAPAKSVVDFSLFYFPAGTSPANNKYGLLLEGAQFADQHGFKAIWVPERHFHAFGDQFPNPSVAAAAVSTITRNIKIRSGSVVLPLHDPVRVAEEWSMIDNLSSGRVELSIASGWHPNDFVLAPDEYANRRQSMRQKISILKDLWQGKSLVRKNGAGRDFEFTIYPKPIQEELPLWITAAGGIDTFRYAGSIGANVLTHLLGQSIEELGEKIKIYRETLWENGFDPQQGKVALMVHTFVGSDPEEVRKIVETPFKNYLKTSLDLLKALAEEKGLDAEKDMEELIELGFQRYYSTGSLFGTPASCVDTVNRIYSADVNEIACLIDFGVEEETVRANFQHLFTLKELIRRTQHQADLILEHATRLAGKEDTIALIERHQVTHIQSTPSFYEELLLKQKGKAALQQIKTLLVGGESLKRSLAENLLSVRGKEIHNMYGPTETTIWSSIKTITTAQHITIGSPIINTTMYVLDHQRQLCPIGVAGELYIGGHGVALGYIHEEALTAARFIGNPFVANQRMYRTGDLARWLPEGELEYLGRLDRQEKIRGYRVELEEVEYQLASHPQVREAVVLAKDQFEDKHLVAYYVASMELDAHQLRNYLSAKIPEFMIPAFFVRIHGLPLNVNGKVDIQALPEPGQCLTGDTKAPQTALEEQLLSLWQQVLSTDHIGTNVDFFSVGGNSMKLIRLFNLISEHIPYPVEVHNLFEHRTIKGFADFIEKKYNTQNSVPIKKKNTIEF
ncbi:MAG: MupA/Atu3671 family FMN-dependent luciferase-like monooxygenase [Ginsengibacter sp.]